MLCISATEAVVTVHKIGVALVVQAELGSDVVAVGPMMRLLLLWRTMRCSPEQVDLLWKSI